MSYREEEAKNLEKVIQEISNRIDFDEKQYQIEVQNMRDSQVLSTEIDNFRVAKRSKTRLEQNLKKYRKALSEPYFGRVKLSSSDNNDSKSRYVGYVDLDLDDELVIRSWPSIYHDIYTQKHIKEFSIDNRQYDLMLRRSFVFDNGQLKKVINEYEFGDELFDDGVTDPFLLEILMQKRSQRKMTDIVKTIQRKQMEIIQLDPNQDFIVQGCAGSGKSMVLLHRISYLMYHNRNIDYRSICIIVPNNIFINQISSVLDDLNLDNVQIMTIRSLYLYIIKKYGQKPFNKTANFIDESSFSPEFLQRVYSQDFIKDMMRIYDGAILRLVDMKYIDVINSLNEMNTDFPRIDRKNYSKNELLNDLNAIQTEYYRIQQRIKFLEKITSLDESIKEVKDYKRIKKNRIKRLDDLRVKNIELRNYYKDLYYSQSKKFSKLKDTEVDSMSIDLPKIRSINSIYSDFKDIKNAIIDKMLATKEVLALYEQLQELSQEIELNSLMFEQTLMIYEKLKFYEVFKSRKIKDKLNHDINQFNNFLINSQTEYKSILNELKAEKITLANKLKDIEDVLIVLENESGLDMEKDNHQYFENTQLMEYQVLFDELKNSENTVVEFENDIIRYKAELETIKNLMLNKTKEKELKNAFSMIINDLNDNSLLLNRILILLLSGYQRELELLLSSNSKIAMYLSISFYHKTIGKIDSEFSYLHFDEGQDLLLADYQLIKDVFKNNVVFNIYGDENQNIFYDFAYSWSDLAKSLKCNTFTLNQNYRNTIELTEYSNDRFKFNIDSVGINGPEVEHISLTEFFERISDIEEEIADKRVAIIANNLDEEWIHDIKNNIENNDLFVENKIEKGKLSLFDVVASKGLEFEKVITSFDGMNKNEQYIAVTRSLNELIVIKEGGN